MLSLDISFDPVCLLKDKLMDRKAISPSPVEVLYLQLEKLGSNLNPLKKKKSVKDSLTLMTVRQEHSRAASGISAGVRTLHKTGEVLSPEHILRLWCQHQTHISNNFLLE